MKLAGLRGMFLENWGLKLLSLAFATLLWMFVVGEKRSEVSLSPPLELTRVPQDLVVTSPVPENIRVRLSGPRTLLAAVNPQQLSVALDLEGIQPGVSSFEILPSRLNLPRGIEVTYISPSVLTLEADRKVAKTVPIKPRTRGTPAEGFEVLEVSVDPAEVELEGPERVMKQLREVPTEVVDVTGLEGSVTRPVELAFPDPTLRAQGKPTVRLDAVIREMRAEREFIQVPVAVPAEPWTTRPSAVDVKVQGGLRLVSGLKATDIRAAVPPFGERPPEGPVGVVVNVPPGIQVVSVVPTTVDVAEVVEPLEEDAPPPSDPGTQNSGE